MAYKMKGFRGFGNSPLKQVEKHGRWLLDTSTKEGKAISKQIKSIPTVSSRGGASTLSKLLKGAGRLVGGGVIASTLYDFYKSGQKHSGGKAVKGQKSFMADAKKKTKSIYTKKK